MIRSLYSAISGMRHTQDRMDVIGNNIANVNTTGFKSSRTDFADAFYQTLRFTSPGTGGNNNSNPMQLGTGVTTTGIKTSFNQGAMARTGNTTDLAVAGEGFFIVKDTVSGENFATRSGDFHVDAQGYLITNTGQRIQGYTDSGLSTLGDVKIDASGAPSSAAADAVFKSFSITDSGQINVALSDGTTFVRGQILLQDFQNPQALSKAGNNLYSGIANAGGLDWSAGQGVPQTGSLGEIASGHLELSNVDLAEEFTNLITTQRSYQANARIITTSDELLQELVNLKR